jgi:hypothetical protein
MSTCTKKPNQQWEFVKQQPDKYVGDCQAMAGSYNRTFKDTDSDRYNFLPPGSITFDKDKGVGTVKQGETNADFTCIEKNVIRVPDMGNIEGKGDGKQIKWSNGVVWKKEERPVLLYEDYWFEGRDGKKNIELQPGRYPSIKLVGIDNDTLSSIKVPEGRKVTLFEHGDYSGRRLEVTENIARLEDYDFNDITSSIIVT